MRKFLFVGRPINNSNPVHGDLIQLHDGRMFIVNSNFGACIDQEGNFVNTGYPYVIQVKPESVELFKAV